MKRVKGIEPSSPLQHVLVTRILYLSHTSAQVGP